MYHIYEGTKAHDYCSTDIYLASAMEEDLQKFDNYLANGGLSFTHKPIINRKLVRHERLTDDFICTIACINYEDKEVVEQFYFSKVRTL